MEAFWLDNAAQTRTVLSKEGTSVTGNWPLKILKLFILLMTCSMRILRLAIFLVLVSAVVDIYTSPCKPGGWYNLIIREAHSSNMLKALVSLQHVMLITFVQKSRMNCYIFVTNTSTICCRSKGYWGVRSTCYKKFGCVMMFVIRSSYIL